MMRKKVDNQIRNDLQMSHAIAIYLVFKKLSGKKQKKHFWFKTLKLLTLQFQFRKTLGEQELPLKPFPPPSFSRNFGYAKYLATIYSFKNFQCLPNLNVIK